MAQWQARVRDGNSSPLALQEQQGQWLRALDSRSQ
jgi:hypothetical protein